MPDTTFFTPHALLRMAQRCLSHTDVLYVIEHGIWVWRAGALHIILLTKNLQRQDRRQQERLVGTVVLMDPGGEDVWTVYRGNRKSVAKAIRCKTKLDLKKPYGASSQSGLWF